MQAAPQDSYSTILVYKEILDTSDTSGNPLNTVLVASRGFIPEYFPSKESLISRMGEIVTTRDIKEPTLRTLEKPKDYGHQGIKRRMLPLESAEFELLFQELSAAMPNLRRVH